MEWSYANFKDGKLFDDEGYLIGDFPLFGSSIEANKYIVENDLRITIR